MLTAQLEYNTLPGTAASIGRAGAHTIVADRAEGRARGSGLGFNGGQLLAAALGGCFSNTLYLTAEKMGLVIAQLKLAVEIDLDGEPLVAKAARIKADIRLEGGTDPAALIAASSAACMVANTLRAGAEVTIA